MSDSSEKPTATYWLERLETDPKANEALFLEVQKQLRDFANLLLRDERFAQDVQATMLLNDAFLDVVNREHPQFENSQEFISKVKQKMRWLLRDHWQQQTAIKRGGDGKQVANRTSFEMIQEDVLTESVEILALQKALVVLGVDHPEEYELILRKHFTDTSATALAKQMKISPKTLRYRMKYAEARLREIFEMEVR